MPGPNQAFNDLVARLAAAKMENEVLRQSLIPPLAPESLARLMTEQVAYAWMACLQAGVKSCSEQDPAWASSPLASLIWQGVNDEHKAESQGR